MALLRTPQLDGSASGCDNAVTYPLHWKGSLLISSHDSNRIMSQQGEVLLRMSAVLVLRSLRARMANTQGMMGSLFVRSWSPRRRLHSFALSPGLAIGYPMT